METPTQTDSASVSDTQPASVEAGKSLILRVYEYTERMELYGWTLTRHCDGLDRYGYLEENGFFKEISFAQIVDFCKRNISMSEVAACCDILPLGDELYGDYPPANQPVDDMHLESQNVEAFGGALPCTRVPLNGLTSKRSSKPPSGVWGLSRNGFYYPRAVLLLLAIISAVFGVLIIRTFLYSLFFRKKCRKPDATNR